MLARDVARQRDHRRRAEQADVDAGGREPRRIGGHRQIAGRHQLAAGRGGDAAHLGDHRLRQAHDRLHQGRTGFEQLDEVGLAAVGVGAPRSHLLEVMPGAEMIAGTAQDDRPDRPLGRDFVETGLQRSEHFLGQRIDRPRTIQHHAGDPVLQVEIDWTRACRLSVDG